MPIVNAKHLAPQGGGYEPQRTFNWEVEINDGNTIIRLAAIAVTLPQEGNEPIELPYGNESHWVAGRTRFQFGQLVVRDMVDMDTNRVIAEWRKKVYEAQGGTINWATGYKRDATLILLCPKGGNPRQWKLEGVWPQQVNYGQLNYQSNDVVSIEVTFAMDRAYRI